MKILVTRPEPDASALGDSLRQMGHEPVIEPLTEFRLLHEASLPVDGVQAVVATSRNGLRALQENVSFDALVKLPLFAVGTATATFGRSLGFRNIVAGDQGGQLLSDLICEKLDRDHGVLLHLAARDVAFDLGGALEKRGYRVLAPIVYEMAAKDGFSSETQRLFAEEEIDSVILLSPRAAKIFTNLVQHARISSFCDRFKVLCLSKRIADALDIQGEIDILYPQQPDLEEVLSLVN